MKFNTRFTREHKAPRIVISEPSLTKQSFAKEADINTIVGRVIKGGIVPQGDRKPQYGDFVGLDYRAMQDRIAQVNQSFAELPSDLRRRFDNDPQALLDFIGNPENEAEAVELGLLPTFEQNTPPEAPGKGVPEPVKTETPTPAAPPAAQTA